jgi:hypothetical protein
MELFLLYLWLKINSVIAASVAAALVLAVVALFKFMAVGIDRDVYGEQHAERNKVGSRWARGLVAAAVPFALVAVLTPNKTDIAILVGAAYAIDLARSPEGAKVQTLIRAKANELLDAEIAKLKPKESK